MYTNSFSVYQSVLPGSGSRNQRVVQKRSKVESIYPWSSLQQSIPSFSCFMVRLSVLLPGLSMVGLQPSGPRHRRSQSKSQVHPLHMISVYSVDIAGLLSFSAVDPSKALLDLDLFGSLCAKPWTHNGGLEQRFWTWNDHWPDIEVGQVFGCILGHGFSPCGVNLITFSAQTCAGDVGEMLQEKKHTVRRKDVGLVTTTCVTSPLVQKGWNRLEWYWYWFLFFHQIKHV